MSNIITTRDLAMIFYNEFVESGGDVYDPDSKFFKIDGRDRRDIVGSAGFQNGE